MNKGYQYLINRGLTTETIERFQLAYCDELGKIVGYSFPKELAEEVKRCNEFAAIKKQKKFQDGVLIPMLNLYGQPIAVTARLLNSDLKYTATSFNKSYTVFLLNDAYESILSMKYVVLVEGVFDAIFLHQNGFRNVVSILGSSLTQPQLCLLTRFTNDFAIMLDGDSAGKAAAIRVKKYLVTHNLKSKLVFLPQDEDPDSFVRKYGNQKLRELLAK